MDENKIGSSLRIEGQVEMISGSDDTVGIPFDGVMKKSIGYYVANLVFNGDLIRLDNFGS